MNWDKYLSPERLRISTREKKQDARNEFESDFGRVIFSPAMRRMHDKTQVFPLTTDDNIHSRLTHSMEVMSVGHSLAINLCDNKDFIEEIKQNKDKVLREIPVIIKNACLVHDIGNPPFGHFGETVIQGYFEKLFEKDNILEEANNHSEKQFDLTKVEREDFEYFDGNAQGFRLLTKLQVLDDPYGLNLTYATLGAYLKYPNTDDKVKLILSQKKRGVFQSEKSYLATIAKSCGLSLNDKFIRHPLSFIMEAADSICYMVMDIEDGFNKKWFDYAFLKEKLSTIPGMPETFNYLDGKFKNEITKVVNLRLALIKKLVIIAEKNFTTNLGSICEGKYNEELIKDDVNGLAKKLNNFCAQYIFSHKDIMSLELTGHSVLTGLLDYYISFCFHKNEAYRSRGVGLISNSIIRAALIETKQSSFEDLTDYYKLRVIVDFISGMTDQYALNHFQKLSGQKIN